MLEFNLGQNYYSALSVENNLNEAMKWYQASAEQSHAQTQYNLGIFYNNGIAVEQNNIEAAKWFQRAAEQGKQLNTSAAMLPIIRKKVAH